MHRRRNPRSTGGFLRGSVGARGAVVLASARQIADTLDALQDPGGSVVLGLFASRIPVRKRGELTIVALRFPGFAWDTNRSQNLQKLADIMPPAVSAMDVGADAIFGLKMKVIVRAEDAVEDQELSQAIIAFLAKGRSPFPKADEAAVLELPVADPAVLLGRVRAVADEMMAIEIDWSSSTLSEGGREAQPILADRHPELTHEALEALYWMFTYNWR